MSKKNRNIRIARNGDIIKILENIYGKEKSPVAILTDDYKRKLSNSEKEKLIKKHEEIKKMMADENDIPPPFAYLIETEKLTQEDIDWALKNNKTGKQYFKCSLCEKNEVTIDEEEIIYGGTIDIIHPGYGSKFDLIDFKIVVCDDCIQTKLKTQKINQY